MPSHRYHMQRGRGIGSLIKGLSRSIFPAVKYLFKTGTKVGKKVLTHPEMQKIVKSVAKHGKDALIDSAIDLVNGEDVGYTAKQRLYQTKKEISDDLKNQLKQLKNRQRGKSTNDMKKEDRNRKLRSRPRKRGRGLNPSTILKSQLI